MATNFLGVKYYGEVEFWFACLKVTLLVGLIIFGIVADVGGVNGGEFPISILVYLPLPTYPSNR